MNKPPGPAAPFEWPLRIYWEDTDAGGIVFYANYLKFFERARTEWLRARGVHQQRLREAAGGMFVVTETSLKYHRPARLDDALAVTVALQDCGGCRATLHQQALLKSEQNSQDNQAAPLLLCEGVIRIGWVDAATLRPARMPPDLMEMMKA